jgi:hypothetical protein
MVVVSITSLNKEEFRNFIDSFDTVLTDCDGMYNIILYVHLHSTLWTVKKMCTGPKKVALPYAMF